MTFTPPTTGIYGSGTTLSGAGGASDNPVTFTIDPSSAAGVCSLVGTALSYTGVGNGVVDANQARNCRLHRRTAGPADDRGHPGIPIDLAVHTTDQRDRRQSDLHADKHRRGFR